MEAGLILYVEKLQESFWITVESFWGSEFLLGIDADVLFHYIGGILEGLIFVILWSGVLLITTHRGRSWYSEVGINNFYCGILFLTLSSSEVSGGRIQCLRRQQISLVLLYLFFLSKRGCPPLPDEVHELNQGMLLSWNQ